MNSTTFKVAPVTSDPRMKASIEEQLNRWMELQQGKEVYEVKVFRKQKQKQFKLFTRH